MATPAQVLANQANAQKSTGPVTAEGKAKSSRNRLSHGFAGSIRFIPGEDPEKFKALLLDLMREHQPATPTQQILVEMMAHHRWISLRASRIQDDIMAGMEAVSDVIRTLPMMIRYQSTAERAFHKAHAEIVKARKEALDRQIGFESQNACEPAGQTAEEAPKSSAQAPESSKRSPKLSPDAEAEALMAYLDRKYGLTKGTVADGAGAGGL